MDEADFLGDRIAIMSNGSLKCCGSPLYLKTKYGNGYNLVINKKKASSDTDTANSTDFSLQSKNTTNKISDIIKMIIPSATLNSDINSEISFILPTEEAAKFSQLFETLEKSKDDLNIVNIGVSVTTIEDVFLR
jgi:ABC-type multidrug transport system ATPase subunit